MSSDKSIIEAKPLYLGHRARLKARFLADEGASMPDYELLELLLSLAIPRRDVKPLAKNLIAKFGNMCGVINAPSSELINVSGVGKNTALLIKAVALCGVRSGSATFNSRDESVFAFWPDFFEYCRQRIFEDTQEYLHIFFFNDNLSLLGEKKIPKDVSYNLSIKSIICEILRLNATQIVVANNRMSENEKINDEDMSFLQEIFDALLPLDIKILDYLIFFDKKVLSFSKSGRMPSAKIKKFLNQS